MHLFLIAKIRECIAFICNQSIPTHLIAMIESNTPIGAGDRPLKGPVSWQQQQQQDTRTSCKVAKPNKPNNWVTNFTNGLQLVCEVINSFISLFSFSCLYWCLVLSSFLFRLLVLWLLAFGLHAKGKPPVNLCACKTIVVILCFLLLGHGSGQGDLAPPFGSAGSSPRSLPASWDPQYSQLQSNAAGFLQNEAGVRYLAFAPMGHVVQPYDHHRWQQHSASLPHAAVVPRSGEWSIEPVEAICPLCPDCPEISPCPLPEHCPQPHCVPNHLPCPCSIKCCKRSRRCLSWHPW